MTLVAGFRCWDGFVIAADTEMALGSVRYQGQKLAMSSPNDPYTLCIGFAGDESCGLAVSQEIREAVAALKSPPFAKIKRVVCNIVAEFYPKHVLKDWSVIGEQPPDFRLVIGIRDHADKCGVLCTDRDVVHEVVRSVFIGSGNEIASYVCEKLFDGRQLPTAVTHHLALQVFREVHNTAAYVGGNIEVFGRRASSAAPFFETPSLDRESRATWGLTDILLSAVKVALDRHFNQEADVMEGIDSRVDEDTRVLGDGYEMFTTEYRTGVGRPFKDSV